MFPIGPSVCLIVSLAQMVQSVHDETIAKLIETLGKANYRERQTATDRLKKIPSAATHLRAALKSSDLETNRRINAILYHYDWLRVRDLQAARKQGNAVAFIDLLARWPKRKFEEEAWSETRQLILALEELHHKNRDQKFRHGWTDRDTGPRLVMVKDRFEQSFDGGLHPFVFLRAKNVIWIERGFGVGKVIVASESIQIKADHAGGVFLAGGPVHVSSVMLSSRVMIISQGDVTLERGASGCVVIAKGNVTCGELHNCRVISGKSIIYARTNSRDNIISENDLNPLGFIRWSDTPKKPAATGKEGK